MRMIYIRESSAFEVPENIAQAIFSYMADLATESFHPNMVELVDDKGRTAGEIRLAYDLISQNNIQYARGLERLNIKDIFQYGDVPGLTPLCK